MSIARKIGSALVAVSVILAAGCSLDGMNDDIAADLAAVIEDFKSYRSADMVDPSEDVALAADSQAEASSARAALDFDEAAKAVDGYGVTVVDNGDGTVTVTRTWTIDEATVVSVIVTRPKRPAPDDARWEGGSVTEIEDDATEVRKVNEITVAEASLAVTWKLEAGQVYRYRMVREGETLKPFGTVAVRTEAEWAADGSLVTKTVTYVGAGPGGAIVTRTFTIELVEIDGQIWRKLVTPDRPGYAIVKSFAPRVVEYYDEAGDLFLVVTHERVIGTGIVVTREWYEDGELVRTASGVIRIRAVGGVVTMVREIGGRRTEVTVEETETGYLVTRGDTVYEITMSGGVVTIRTDKGAWTVTYGPDGEAIVTRIS